MSPLRTPLLRVLLPLAAGIGVGEWSYDRLFVPYGVTCPDGICWGLSAACWLVLGVRLFRGAQWHALRKRVSALWPILWAILALFFLGMALMLGQRRSGEVRWPDGAQTWRAVVCAPPRLTPQGQRVRVRIVDGAVTKVGCKAELFLAGRNPLLRVGDGLLVHTRIAPPRAPQNPGEIDYAAYLRTQGVSGAGQAFTRDWCRSPRRVPLTLTERALLLRTEWVDRYADFFEGHDLAVLAAMTLGDRSFLDSETRQLYSMTGASHVLALSGLHLAILYALFQWTVLRSARRWGRWAELAGVLSGWTFIWMFTFLAGMPVSLVRAALMFTFAQGFAFVAQRAEGVHHLLLAALLMLVARPEWLFDVGFQLSCMAVAGIVILRPLMIQPQCLKVPASERIVPSDSRWPPLTKGLRALGRSVWELFTVSFAAQLATAPLVVWHFHLLAPAGLVSSLWVIPAAYLILGGAVVFLLFPFLRVVIAPCLSIVLRGTEHGLSLLARMPASGVDCWVSLWTVVLAYVVLFGAATWMWTQPRWSHRRKMAVWSALFLLGIGMVLSIPVHRPPSAPTLWVYHSPSTPALHLIAPNGQSLLLAGDPLRAKCSLAAVARNAWRRDHLAVTFCPLGNLRTEAGARVLTQSAPSVARHFALVPGVVVCGRWRMAVVDRQLSSSAPRQPLAVEVLLLTAGSTRPLENILRYYRPRCVLLCASLSDYRRRRYRTEAQILHLPLRDVAEEGAVQLVEAADMDKGKGEL